MSSSSSIEHQDPRSGTPPYPYVDGNQTWKRMSFLTVSSFGTQFLWSTEMSQASPYLLSLGISKSQVALVLMAGPLSGKQKKIYPMINESLYDQRKVIIF
ncbi:hypothetical protein PGTUg99_031866 [Puccinia graminis f. sp. tritici]|uniref:Uncharacterized protein n=1 Tax=Puccinia graminis f. sp. tritici TaxID=56615 RepID=A0A5B0RX27_PUCGR|nr:hypothetical protein PGTUg99_031866 [Puccinia graminis f. sp. tritici]